MEASETWYAHLALILLICGLTLAVPGEALSSVWHAEAGVFLGLGILATWRYSWGILHFVRALIYRKISFPRLRKASDAAVDRGISTGQVPHAYLLVTSFRVDADTSASVYRATFEAAMAAPGKTTVVASLVDVSDQRLVTAAYQRICGAATNVRMVIVRIKGTGKRDALANGFRAIANAQPGPDDIVAVIDGDSVVPRDLVAKCLGFFLDNPKVGALTTDEISEVRGRAIFHIWYSLRFAQRNILMASNGLARRVLTLTGRMSMFRADVICNPSFINQVEQDFIDHWRIGRIKFLTGDDKSSWFWLLKNGYQMLYVPDLLVSTVEDPPSDKFLVAAAQLMTRWFGNMLRTNGRALMLGPSRIGYFTWWAIFDQRISMWTSLAGLVMVILIGIFVTPLAFLGYVVWVLVTRYVLTLLLFQSRSRVSALYPFLIYFNQIFGSMVKTYIFFRPNKQRWTRQKTTLAKSGGWLRGAFVTATSTYMHGLAIAVFVTTVAWLIGLLPSPQLTF
ncbi:glycosyltransferase [Devosia psychrophila]|nr:glycosyltransferase [Devosia psychrophila]